MQAEAGDFGNFSHVYQCVIIQQRYPKGKGEGSLQGLTNLIVQSPKQEDPLSTGFLVFVISRYGISVNRYIHIYPFREHTIHYLYNFLCSAFVNLNLKRTSFQRSTVGAILHYSHILNIQVCCSMCCLKKKKYFDVGIELSCCSLFNICLMLAQRSGETTTLLNHQM